MHINSINNNYNTNFKSRNAEIRFADDIARKVNQVFPRISSSKIEDFKNINQYENVYRRAQLKIDLMRSDKYEAYDKFHTFSKKLLAITSVIKAHKVGNCGESAQLSEIAARANGIKDCFCASVLWKGSFGYKYSMDHSVLLVKNNGKPYVIDSWLGFADYLPEAIKRYQKEFRIHFDFKHKNGKMCIDRPVSYDPTGKIFAKKYSDEELRKLYPELILKKPARKLGKTQ